MGRATMSERTTAAMMAGHEKYPAMMMATERLVVTMEKKKWYIRG